MRYLPHERSCCAPVLHRLSLAPGVHRPRRVALLSLRAQLAGCGGAAGRARGARHRRDDPQVVPPPIRSGLREQAAPSPTAPWGYVAPGRGLHAQQWRDALPLARGCSGWHRAQHPGAVPPQCGSTSASCSSGRQLSHASRSPTSARVMARPSGTACRGWSIGGIRGATTAPSMPTNPRGGASGGCAPARRRVWPDRRPLPPAPPPPDRRLSPDSRSPLRHLARSYRRCRRVSTLPSGPAQACPHADWSRSPYLKLTMPISR